MIKDSNPVDGSTPKRRYKLTVRRDKDVKKVEYTLPPMSSVAQSNDPAVNNAEMILYIKMVFWSIEETKDGLAMLKESIAKMGIK